MTKLIVMELIVFVEITANKETNGKLKEDELCKWIDTTVYYVKVKRLQSILISLNSIDILLMK